MNSEWKTVALGEILRQVKRPELVADLDEVPFAGVRWYAEGVYHRATLPREEVKTKVLHRIELNDIVYNRMWATKASFGRVKKDAAGCLVTNDFPICVVDPCKALPGFVELIFQQPGFQNAAAAAATGTTERRRLHERDFLAIRISLPDIAEQRRIVDLLGTVNRATADADEVVDASASLMASTLRSFRNSARKVSIGSFCSFAYGKALKASDRENGPFSVFGAAGSVGVHTSNTTRGSGRVLVVGRKGVNSKADLPVPLRVTPDGRKGWGGAGAVNYSAAPVWVIDTAYQVNLFEDVDPRAAYWSLVLADLPKICTTTTLPGLSREAALACMTHDPSSFSSEGLDLLDALETVILRTATLASSLRNVKSELLMALTSGAHRIPDTYDELMGA